MATFAGPIGKSTKKAVEGLFEAPRLYRGKIQHYTFPKATVARIQAGVAEGKLDRKVNQAQARAVSAVEETHAPIVLGHNSPDITHSLQMLIAHTPLEKEVLIAQQNEENFYKEEIENAKQLQLILSSLHYIGKEETMAIASTIVQTIKNHALQTYMLEALMAKDVYTMNKDLSDYFCLNKPFHLCAFNYTVRHPRQQILMMRRLLNNPLVDENAKMRVRAFLAKPQITLEDSPAFLEAIDQLYTQYHQRLLVARESEIIQMQIAYYAKLLDRLNAFLVRKERIPKWNTTDPEEKLLFDELEWVKLNQDRNTFEPIASYQQAIESTLRNAAPVYLTQEETVALFDEFVKVTHRIYPRSLRDLPNEGDIPFAQEEELWDNLSYWRIRDSSINGKLAEVYKKYPRLQ